MVLSYDDVMRMLVPSEKLMLVKMLKLEKEEITKETQDDVMLKIINYLGLDLYNLLINLL